MKAASRRSRRGPVRASWRGSEPHRARLRPHRARWPGASSRITGTPVRYVGQVYAANEADAIKRAIEEYDIHDPEMQKRLIARRAG